MTVTYTLEVATSKLGRFLSLLIRWRGSIYKLVWREFILFVLIYYCINLTYRFALPPKHQGNFHKVVHYCNSYSNLIPLSFILGFYVTLVVGRWWNQFCTIPWPDKLALYVTTVLQGLDERGRLMRRTIMRYCCLTYVITMSSISPPVKKRFPTFTHMTEAGFMLPNEQKILEEIPIPNNKFFIPLIWSASLATRARKEGRIKDDHALKTIIDEINAYRGSCGVLLSYDWISIPLVYTQVVTLATYSFFLATLLGAQTIKEPNVQSFDIYVPVFSFLQFFFYMGWLKVAETLVNPFGEDDDDFDINSLVDRNLLISYLVVDEIHQEHPELIKDQYWDEVQFDLPYTPASEPNKKPGSFLGSAHDIRIDPEKKEFVLESVIEGDEDEENNSLQKSFSTPAVSAQEIHDQNSKMSTVAASAPVEPVVIGGPRRRWSPAGKLRKFFRSFSRDSRRMEGSNLSLASSKRSKHRGSSSSVATHEQLQTPSIQGDIFNLEDLYYMEDDTDSRGKLSATPSVPSGIHTITTEKPGKDTTKENKPLLPTTSRSQQIAYNRQLSSASRLSSGLAKQPRSTARLTPPSTSNQAKLPDHDATKSDTTKHDKNIGGRT